MKIKTIFYLLLLLATTLACRQNKTQSNTPVVAAQLEAEDRDSLFIHYLRQLPNDYPTEAVYEQGKLYPEDAAPLDSTFLIYRGQLLDAVQAKDLIALLPMLDNNIKCSFGTCEGKAGFAELWQLDDPDQIASSPVWAELESVLVRGGSFNNPDFFIAPYIFANWPDAHDAFEYALIAGGGVRMRESPRLGTKILKNLSHDIVKVLDTQGPEETISGETFPWIKVETLDGTAGHVWGKFVVSSLDFRAGFERKAGAWKMTFFLAGD